MYDTLRDVDDSKVVPLVPRLVLKGLEKPQVPRCEPLCGSLLFVDISGFSSVTSKLRQLHNDAEGAETLSLHINGYFSRLIAVVRRYSGDIVFFSGDAMMVSWTDYTLQEACSLCLLCGKRLLEETPEHTFNLEVGSTVTCTMSLHIGAAAGDFHGMVVGGKGHRSLGKLKYLLTGAPVEECGIAASVAATGEFAFTETLKRYVEEEGVVCRAESVGCHAGDSGGPPVALCKYASCDFSGASQAVGAFVQSPVMSQKGGAGFRNASPPSSPAKRVEQGSTEPERALEKAYLPLSDESKDNAAMYVFDTVVRSATTGGTSGSLRTVCTAFIKLSSIPPGGPPEALHRKLNQSVEIIQKQLARYGGVLNKVMMDDKGIICLCLFGIPLHAHENDSSRVVHFAMRAARALGECNITASIGVSKAPVFCGLTGSRHRHEYTVLGGGVNLAARLMMKSADFEPKKYHVLVDAAVAQSRDLQGLSASGYAIIEGDLALLKGIPDPVRCYHLIKESDREAVTAKIQEAEDGEGERGLVSCGSRVSMASSESRGEQALINRSATQHLLRFVRDAKRHPSRRSSSGRGSIHSSSSSASKKGWFGKKLGMEGLKKVLHDQHSIGLDDPEILSSAGSSMGSFHSPSPKGSRGWNLVRHHQKSISSTPFSISGVSSPTLPQGERGGPFVKPLQRAAVAAGQPQDWFGHRCSSDTVSMVSEGEDLLLGREQVLSDTLRYIQQWNRRASRTNRSFFSPRSEVSVATSGDSGRLNRLQQHHHTEQHHLTRMVFLRGERKMGLSLLLERVCAMCPTPVTRIQCSESAETGNFYSVRYLLQQVLLETDIHSLLLRLSDTVTDDIPLLHYVLRLPEIPLPDHDLSGMRADEKERRISELVLDMLRCHYGTRFLLAVDDLQWMDDSSLAFIEVARDDPSVFCVVTDRREALRSGKRKVFLNESISSASSSLGTSSCSELSGPIPLLRGPCQAVHDGSGVIQSRREAIESNTSCVVLDVPPVSLDISNQIICKVVECAEVEPSLGAALHEKSDGLPGYLIDIAKALQASDMISVDHMGKLVPSIDADLEENLAQVIPQEMEGQVMLIVDTLSPLERRVASVMAVLGRSAPKDLLFQSLAAEEIPWGSAASALSHLREIELLDEVVSFETKEVMVCFNKQLNRDILYNSILTRDRRRLHWVVSQVLERCSEPNLKYLAGHYIRAQQVGFGWISLDTHARTLLSQGTFKEAIKILAELITFGGGRTAEGQAGAAEASPPADSLPFDRQGGMGMGMVESNAPGGSLWSNAGSPNSPTARPHPGELLRSFWVLSVVLSLQETGQFQAADENSLLHTPMACNMDGERSGHDNPNGAAESPAAAVQSYCSVLLNPTFLEGNQESSAVINRVMKESSVLMARSAADEKRRLQALRHELDNQVGGAPHPSSQKKKAAAAHHPRAPTPDNGLSGSIEASGSPPGLLASGGIGGGGSHMSLSNINSMDLTGGAPAAADGQLRLRRLSVAVSAIEKEEVSQALGVEPEELAGGVAHTQLVALIETHASVLLGGLSERSAGGRLVRQSSSAISSIACHSSIEGDSSSSSSSAPPPGMPPSGRDGRGRSKKRKKSREKNRGDANWGEPGPPPPAPSIARLFCCCWGGGGGRRTGGIGGSDTAGGSPSHRYEMRGADTPIPEKHGEGGGGGGNAVEGTRQTTRRSSTRLGNGGLGGSRIWHPQSRGSSPEGPHRAQQQGTPQNLQNPQQPPLPHQGWGTHGSYYNALDLPGRGSLALRSADSMGSSWGPGTSGVLPAGSPVASNSPTPPRRKLEVPTAPLCHAELDRQFLVCQLEIHFWTGQHGIASLFRKAKASCLDPQSRFAFQAVEFAFDVMEGSELLRLAGPAGAGEGPPLPKPDALLQSPLSIMAAASLEDGLEILCRVPDSIASLRASLPGGGGGLQLRPLPDTTPLRTAPPARPSLVATALIARAVLQIFKGCPAAAFESALLLKALDYGDSRCGLYASCLRSHASWFFPEHPAEACFGVGESNAGWKAKTWSSWHPLSDDQLRDAVEKPGVLREDALLMMMWGARLGPKVGDTLLHASGELMTPCHILALVHMLEDALAVGSSGQAVHRQASILGLASASFPFARAAYHGYVGCLADSLADLQLAIKLSLSLAGGSHPEDCGFTPFSFKAAVRILQKHAPGGMVEVEKLIAVGKAHITDQGVADDSGGGGGGGGGAGGGASNAAARLLQVAKTRVRLGHPDLQLLQALAGEVPTVSPRVRARPHRMR